MSTEEIRTKIIEAAKNKALADAIEALYKWIDEQTIQDKPLCEACGKCCDFQAYGHRLYVTSAEMAFVVSKLGKDNIRPMMGANCPWQIEGKCSIHPHRFAACRIFFCKADGQKQSEISEESLRRIKSICIENALPYVYMELKQALSDY